MLSSLLRSDSPRGSLFPLRAIECAVCVRVCVDKKKEQDNNNDNNNNNAVAFASISGREDRRGPTPAYSIYRCNRRDVTLSAEFYSWMCPLGPAVRLTPPRACVRACVTTTTTICERRILDHDERVRVAA